MKLPATIFLLASASVVFAAAETELLQDEALPLQVPQPVKMTEGMPAGAMFTPLTHIPQEPVTVPEPVWASVLAACAVSLLRRARS